MNRLENMETFIRVVENGGISAAADHMNIAKSAVSRRLKELENHLGVELFHRTTRKMNLTDTGADYFQNCVRILDQILETELAASQAHDTLKGNLKITLPATFGLMHIAPIIDDFLREHPQIKFDLDFNDREVDLMQEGFDLAIRIAHLSDSSLIARRIASTQSVICASHDYLKTHGTPKTPDELVDHQCLVYSLIRDFEYWRLVDSNNQTIKIKLQPYLRASSGEYLLDSAIHGHGIVLLPTFIVYRALKQGLLTTILDNYRLPEMNVYAIYPQTRHLSQRVRRLVDFLVERFQGIPYWEKH